MTSSGFCLLNTVAVAAAYARYNYSIVTQPAAVPAPAPVVPVSVPAGKTAPSSRGEERCVRGHPAGSRPLRVAIVDIDVHHGNGTEEIVKNLM
jgi:hypothetical protein